MHIFSELQEIENAIKKGFANARKSLAMMLHAEVELTDLEEITYQDLRLKQSYHTYYIFETHIVGEKTGISFWLIGQPEFDLICQRILGNSYSQEKQNELSRSLLLELDNILSASVITELANELNLKIHGDIPRISTHTDEQILAIIKQHCQENPKMHLWLARFVIASIPIEMLFIWLF
ncbi:MAG: hypothetical protein NZ519_00315 [Bacteroidia bacterium]|nr:hypothetical protein [Bacteroidia bacterium]MDW8300833.1 hypothetical protein [Bacteroidia bacterium]